MSRFFAELKRRDVLRATIESQSSAASETTKTP